jgi:salicylate hydroxylase
VAAQAIAVVGAGIGGLTAALALARHGHGVTLVERRTGFSEVGAGLQLSPNASRVLLGLGLGPALRRVATEPDRVVIRSVRSGEEIGRIALGSFMRERFGAPYWVVHRADLQTVLLDAIRSQPNIRLSLGRTVDGAAALADRATLAMTTSRQTQETLSADLVVGADGAWSKVRRALQDGDDPVFRGYVAWRTTIDRASAPAELAGNETGLWLGRKAHVVHYPIAGGRLLNIVAIRREARPVDGWAEPGDRTELLAHFSSASPLLRRLVSLPQHWLLWSLFDRPAQPMARGRIALLGDAAHPVLPFLAQGAALAIEDAAALCHSLQARPVAEALQAYATDRLGRVREVQNQARRNGRIYHAAGPVAFVRDRIMRNLGPEGMSQRYAWLYGFVPPGQLALAPSSR